jgi:hypothetical protein
MTIGTFGGLVLCDQMDITELKPKWAVSLALGLVLWIAVMFVEAILFNALGMFVGGTAAMLLFSMVVQYAPPMPGYYFFIFVGVGVAAGWFLSGYIKNLALTLIYSIQGGFLMGSCVSYTFWRGSAPQPRTTPGRVWTYRASPVHPRALGPSSRNTQPYTLSPQTCILHPSPYTLNPESRTLNP